MPLTLRDRWTENRRRRAAGLPEVLTPQGEAHRQRLEAGSRQTAAYLQRLHSDPAFAQAAWRQWVDEVNTTQDRSNYRGD